MRVVGRSWLRYKKRKEESVGARCLDAVPLRFFRTYSNLTSFSLRLCLYVLRQPRLVPRRIIRVNQAFPGCPVEQPYGGGVGGHRFLLGADGPDPLQGGPQGGALGAVCDGMAARLAHRFLGGLNSRHETLLPV